MKKDLQEVNNFDFLARSFARMQALGQDVDIQAVTGNMNMEQKAWFQVRYEHYCQQNCQQTARTRELQLEH